MAITYEWTFTPEVADEDGKTDVVKVVHWRLTASEGGVQANIYDAAPLGKPQTPLVAFANLTETKVKGWVLGALGETEAELKARLAAQLDTIKNPPLRRKAVPWA